MSERRILMEEKKTNPGTEENKISSLITSSLEGIRDLVDANTIIGRPIEAGNGTVIIPVSKVSVGYAGGGTDFAGKHTQPNGKNNFGGGGGTGVSVTPVGFLVVSENGRVEMININNPTGANDIGSSIENIVDKAPEIVEKIKGLFKGKGKDKKAETTPVEDAVENGESAE